jgi:uncharacterized tellurite resistance protein B-like protein
MNTANTNLHLLNQFKGDSDQAQPIHFDHIDLSPPLVLAAALMYMMASDGEIKDSESSQLQSVLGGNDELVACAASYVQSVPLETFLLEAADSLSGLDKLCILTNVCDSFLADGQADAAELALFSRMCLAFGFDEAAFEPYLKTIQLKNDKSALGRYNLAAAMGAKGAISNHLALAACIVYMMASDGNIGTEEIGRLQAAIGEFTGLQAVALKYVLKVKNAQFLKEVAPNLNPDIKLMILTNVCDTLLSDGVVEPAEKKLFASMLTAFGYSEKTFRSYYETLHIKNVKSFDLNDFADSAAAQVFRSAKYQASQVAFNAAHAGEGEHIGTVIHRTMEENIASVSQNAGTPDNVHVMTDNANNRQNIQNIQKIEAGQHEENIQFVEGAGPLAENIQFVDSAEAMAENIQRLDAASGLHASASRMQFGVGGNEVGITSGESTQGIDVGFSSGTDAMMSLEESYGKGGLTTMAQGEVSYRDRAMQNGRALTQFTRTVAPMDAATLRLRLQALKLRNAEVENKLKRLHAGAQDTGGFSTSMNTEVSSAPEAGAITAQSQVSVLQRLNQVVAQGLDLISGQRPAQAGYANAAMT